jgi:hypothetical protein
MQMACNEETGATRRKPRSQGSLVVAIVGRRELETQVPMEVHLDGERVREEPLMKILNHLVYQEEGLLLRVGPRIHLIKILDPDQKGAHGENPAMVHQVVVLGVALMRRSRDDPKAKSPRIRRVRAEMVKDPKARAELVKVTREGSQVVEAQIGALRETLGGLPVGADHGQSNSHLQPVIRLARPNPSYFEVHSMMTERLYQIDPLD